jgi:hypothetical protein
MNAIVEKTDAELKTDVVAELKYEPAVNIADSGVLVKEGAVKLNGFASSFGEKCDAVSATKRVAGVRAIADDIVVRLLSSLLRTDGDIGASAANQISWAHPRPGQWSSHRRSEGGYGERLVCGASIGH